MGVAPMTTLPDFLLNAIAHDEAVARAACGDAIGQRQTGRWVYEHVPHQPTSTTIPIIFAVADRGGKTQVANMEGAWERDERAAHIALHDPARVLAQCAALRAVVALHGAYEMGGGDKYCDSCGDVPQVDHPCPTLIALAQPFRDRDGFDERWLA